MNILGEIAYLTVYVTGSRELIVFLRLYKTNVQLVLHVKKTIKSLFLETNEKFGISISVFNKISLANPPLS